MVVMGCVVFKLSLTAVARLFTIRLRRSVSVDLSVTNQSRLSNLRYGGLDHMPDPAGPGARDGSSPQLPRSLMYITFLPLSFLAPFPRSVLGLFVRFHKLPFQEYHFSYSVD